MLRLQADGSFTGRSWATLWECAGQLDAAQHDELTVALNDANALIHADFELPCADHFIAFIDIEGTDGAATGWSNSFRYDRCSGNPEIATTEALLDVAVQPLVEVNAAGECVACPVEPTRYDCYDNELGVQRFCKSGERFECDVATADDVVDCEPFPSLQCEPARGWVPAATWSVEQATLQRTWNGDGVPTVTLDLRVHVRNLGAHSVAVHEVRDWWRFEDASTGLEVPLVTGVTAASITPAMAGPGADFTYGVIYTASGNPSSPGATQSDLGIRIPERPWEGSPYRPPVPVVVAN